MMPFSHLGRDRLVVSCQCKMQTVLGCLDTQNGQTDWHALEWNWLEQRCQQRLCGEVRQVYTGDRYLRIAQRHGLIISVQSWRASDHSVDLATKDRGFVHDLHPAFAAIGQRRAGQRGEFGVVKQARTLSVADLHRLEPVLGHDVGHHEVGMRQDHWCIVRRTELFGHDVYLADRASDDLSYERKSLDVDLWSLRGSQLRLQRRCDAVLRPAVRVPITEVAADAQHGKNHHDDQYADERRGPSKSGA